MGITDGYLVGTTKIVDNGSAGDRFNIVLVGEGYTLGEQAQFSSHAQQFVQKLFATSPFDMLKCAFNIYRVDIVSNDSGADDPTACGGSGAAPATFFDASYCNAGIRRLLLVDSSRVMNLVNTEVPQWHQILVVVNSSIWGGAGGSIGTTSVSPGWENIAIHEMGHTAFGLADEYPYWAGCGVGVGQDVYSGSEPVQSNVTTNTDRATIKWASHILPATPMPTTSNADCTQCDPQPSPVPAGTVGAFEGAKYYHCGIYRPEFNCMMRDLSPFCAVCKERIRETMAPYLPCSLEVSYYLQRNDGSLEPEAQLEPSDDAVYKIVVTNTGTGYAKDVKALTWLTAISPSGTTVDLPNNLRIIPHGLLGRFKLNPRTAAVRPGEFPGGLNAIDDDLDLNTFRKNAKKYQLPFPKDLKKNPLLYRCNVLRMGDIPAGETKVACLTIITEGAPESTDYRINLFFKFDCCELVKVPMPHCHQLEHGVITGQIGQD